MAYLLAPLVLLAASQSAAVAAPDISKLAGTYELQGVMETASGLRLLPNGRFEFFLVVGALDAAGAGRWRVDGDRVLLTSDQPVVPPRFELKASRKTDERVLRVRVVTEQGKPVDQIDVKVAFDHGETETGSTSEGQIDVPIDERRPIAVELALPVSADIMSASPLPPPFPIDIDKANDLTFVFKPNDFGKVDFRDQPLEIAEDGVLMMSFPGRTVRYVRVDDAE